MMFPFCLSSFSFHNVFLFFFGFDSCVLLFWFGGFFALSFFLSLSLSLSLFASLCLLHCQHADKQTTIQSHHHTSTYPLSWHTRVGSVPLEQAGSQLVWIPSVGESVVSHA